MPERNGVIRRLLKHFSGEPAVGMVCSFAMSHTTRDVEHNQLLASLPPRDAAHLASISRFERPPPGRILTSHSTPAGEVWFPHTGVIALVATDAAGRSVQTGLVGREGGIGLEALFGDAAALPDSVVQIEGAMSVISANALRSVLIERPAIQVALSRFLYGLSAQSLQTIACNRLHTLVSRCCRWLLTFQDRVRRDELPLTQESLATLLGGGRPRVNALLALLEQNGLVRRQRGRIRLLTRSGLKAHSCECYDVSRHTCASLYGSGW
jgi:CRP-like cAMP-binding protein